MTLGRREYSDADMARMQRDAEERVREMQNRARQAVDDTNGGNNGTQSRNRNWNNGTGNRRPQQRRGGQRQNETPQRQQQRPQDTQPDIEQDTQPEPPVQASSSQRTTIVEDIMGALGLDEDYLLIIGLLLILINQRADTTLILALAYLLI
ncbi:MAG: hypothetical protein FWH02_09205 [Oscillospiraceae bacterium]|nr:hypothetical protein [Oscillospiraceae bacterium]